MSDVGSDPSRIKIAKGNYNELGANTPNMAAICASSTSQGLFKLICMVSIDRDQIAYRLTHPAFRTFVARLIEHDSTPPKYAITNPDFTAGHNAT